MKKQKPPVILASVMAVLLIAVFVMAWQRDPQDPQEQMREIAKNMKLTGDSRPAPTKDDIRKSAKVEKESVEMGMDPAMLDRKRPRKPKKPTIFVEGFTPTKPKPNDTTVSSQWYDKESSKNTGN